MLIESQACVDQSSIQHQCNIDPTNKLAFGHYSDAAIPQKAKQTGKTKGNRRESEAYFPQLFRAVVADTNVANEASVVAVSDAIDHGPLLKWSVLGS